MTTVYAQEAARSCLEERYLRGCPVLFSALVGAWEALRGRLEGLAALADQVALLHGSGSIPLALAELHRMSVDAAQERIAELTEAARIGALDMLGAAPTGPMKTSDYPAMSALPNGRLNQ